jgi:hypothetical protein
MSDELTKNPAVNPEDGVLDELQAWFLGQAEREGMVYTAVVRQLMNKMYRDRSYLQKRVKQGRNTVYDHSVERDLRALAWTVRALIRHVPLEEKQLPEPPLKPRKYTKKLTPRQKEIYKGKPSWNSRPMRDWEGPQLPPETKQPR